MAINPFRSLRQRDLDARRAQAASSIDPSPNANGTVTIPVAVAVPVFGLLAWGVIEVIRMIMP